MIEHPRSRLEQRLRDGQRASRIAWEQHPLGQLGRWLKVVGTDVVVQ